MIRETLECDVVIVGAGPAGLAAAIRLKQLNPAWHVCILEKGAEVGAHLLSGAVLEPRALDELLPDWRSRVPALLTAATQDHFLFLTRRRAFSLPVPPQMHNTGNYIISLGQLCRWLATEAEKAGVEIYPGFAAVEAIYDASGSVCGVITGDMGVGKDGKPTSRFQPGIALRAKYTLLAEGCRGSLSKQLIQRYQLQNQADPQTYGLGIKELWEVASEVHHPGKIVHTVGWPLDQQTYGGAFIYHLSQQRIAIGFVVGLDYQNPYLDPFAELQRFKLHPDIKPLFQRARRLGYGARSLCEGGVQSLPTLHFPGGLLMGDAAGFLNVPKIKGIHMAIKSGMVAAESVACDQLENYQQSLEQTWLWEELYRARNIRPGFRWGLWAGLLNAAVDTYVFKGRAPWTLKQRSDHFCLKNAKISQRIDYPKPDNQVTFDKITSLYLANIHHPENQPVHLRLHNPEKALEVNWKNYHSPEQYYCPAQVYEIVQQDHQPKLQINAQNCLHCKACDIKDPEQNIQWVPPEGGSGPNYAEL